MGKRGGDEEDGGKGEEGNRGMKKRRNNGIFVIPRSIFD